MLTEVSGFRVALVKSIVMDSAIGYARFVNVTSPFLAVTLKVPDNAAEP